MRYSRRSLSISLERLSRNRTTSLKTSQSAKPTTMQNKKNGINEKPIEARLR
jgi:hypothetical protein